MRSRSLSSDHDLIEKMLGELHTSYMKNNEHDESDIIYYRINYRIANYFEITNEEADRLHSNYHLSKPRMISQGYCEKCGAVTTIIPFIYGIQDIDMDRMKAAEMEGRLIIGDMDVVKQGSKVAMFGCKRCKAMLIRYGTF